MHHAHLDRWSRGQSPVHARDARAKILLLVIFLVVVATTPHIGSAAMAAEAVLLAAAILLARLPLGAVLLRGAAVLPFSATFALISLLAGDRERALALLAKSYLSASAVLVLAGTTPLPQLLRGLELLGAPRFLLLVVQFLYRYLFVISEQAQHMRLAALCRGVQAGVWRHERSRFRAAAGAVAVLFARSYRRAQGIHAAMLSRGFAGRTELLAPPRLGPADAAFLICGAALLLAVGVLH